MSKTPHDINDDEIRIITSPNKACTNDYSTTSGRTTDKVEPNIKPTPRLKAIWVVAGVIIAAVIFSLVWYFYSRENDDELELTSTTYIGADVADETYNETEPVEMVGNKVGAGYVTISDTVINRVPLTIFNPVNLIPSLHVGADVLNDSTVKFVVQAADIRRDNGGILGAYVDRGELISKGTRKTGFCAIIDDKINIGVADATPLLEQALETGGYFFRQYPLVVGNQVVENKPKNSALRKALAQLNGEPVVIMSRNTMTFHDFSQSLVDLGVTNAIYLVGSKSYGYAIKKDGAKTEFGSFNYNMAPNTNYIVWR